VGMVALVPFGDVDRAVETLATFGIEAWAAGEVALDPDSGGQVQLSGQHPGW
jgi:phosphoribosylformylglycinamidine cyclo-ligase